MTYILSVPAHSPLKRSFGESPYLRPASPLSSDSVNTVRRCRPSNVSATSLISSASIKSSPWRQANENNHPKLSSRSLLDLISELSASATTPDDCFPEKISWVSNIPLPPSPNLREVFKETTDSIHIAESDGSASSPASTFQDAASTIQYETTSESDSISWPIDIPESLNVYNIAFGSPQPKNIAHDDTPSVQPSPDDVSAVDSTEKAAPFRRWISTLRRKNKHRGKNPAARLERWTVDGSETELPKQRMDHAPRRYGHKKSASLTSSLAFVTAVKSASITLASTSIAPLTRFGTKRSRASHAHRGSTVSDTRLAGDSVYPSITPVMDERVWERAKHRRRIVEEIIASEEGYIGDLKVLVNVSTHNATILLMKF